MKKFLIGCVSGILFLCIFVGSNTKINAAEQALFPKIEGHIYSEDKNKVIGEVHSAVVEQKEILSPKLQKSGESIETDNSSRTYETTAEIEYFVDSEESNDSNDVVQPFSSHTGSTSNSIAKASITLVYTVLNNKVRIEKCYGGWTPTSTSSIIVSDRYVSYYSANHQQVGRGWPTSNSFNYVTGWGYVVITSTGKGGGNTTAYTNISGMGKLRLDAGILLN